MFKGQQQRQGLPAFVMLALEHAYCKKSQLLRGTFCFTQVQGPNALTTLLHLTDEMCLGVIRGRVDRLELTDSGELGIYDFKTHNRGVIDKINVHKYVTNTIKAQLRRYGMILYYMLTNEYLKII